MSELLNVCKRSVSVQTSNIKSMNEMNLYWIWIEKTTTT